MAFLNNWNVGGGLSDFWAYVRQDRPHRWTSWGVAMALSGVVFYGIAHYLIPYKSPGPQIIYFENWKADRAQSTVEREWVDRARETTRQNAERRREYQRLADQLGIAYDSAEADRLTRETLGAEADAIGKPAPPPKSTLAARAARKPLPAAK
ncbi:MAG: hypothetical protein RLZZ58_1875 [Pseudomonadota bacterium]|jgi:hypothetical protein